MKYIKYLLLGIVFGVILTKGEVISWWRIQEMFRFQDFHMYGFIASALLVAFTSIQIIKYFQVKTWDGQAIYLIPKELHPGVIIGGTMFGIGWALTGACPGPMYAHVGGGTPPFLIVILSAIAGTFVYGILRPKLPHRQLFKSLPKGGATQNAVGSPEASLKQAS